MSKGRFYYDLVRLRLIFRYCFVFDLFYFFHNVVQRNAPTKKNTETTTQKNEEKQNMFLDRTKETTLRLMSFHN